jgi:hypothetical protein
VSGGSKRRRIATTQWNTPVDVQVIVMSGDVQVIGVPEVDRQRVMAAAEILVTAADPEVMADSHPLELLGGALWTLTEFATELAKHREQHPSDDLMTALVQAGPRRC